MANQLMPLLSLEQAEAVVAHLKADNITAANQIVEDVTCIKPNDELVFGKVGELTRELHDSLISFQEDTRLIDLAGQELPDAEERLNYVIEMTDKAANKTMDAVDACFPIADKMMTSLEKITPSWQGLMTRNLALGDFKTLCHEVDAMITESTSSTSELRSLLTDILMAQDFQDLTGQMIRRVITLVQEIESKLVDILKVSSIDIVPNQEVVVEASPEKNISAEGPIMNAEEREDVVNGQDDVDDLLSSLGF